MIKKVIKCDKCGREFDDKEDSHYYDCYYVFLDGWAGGLADFSSSHTNKGLFQICGKCFKEGMKLKEIVK